MAEYKENDGLPFGCSVSQADKDNGSPKEGDMIAMNPRDGTDTWLVAEKFFRQNYEEVPSNVEVWHRLPGAPFRNRVKGWS